MDIIWCRWREGEENNELGHAELSDTEMLLSFILLSLGSGCNCSEIIHVFFKCQFWKCSCILGGLTTLQNQALSDKQSCMRKQKNQSSDGNALLETLHMWYCHQLSRTQSVFFATSLTTGVLHLKTKSKAPKSHYWVFLVQSSRTNFHSKQGDFQFSAVVHLLLSCHLLSKACASWKKLKCDMGSEFIGCVFTSGDSFAVISNQQPARQINCKS